MGDFAAVFSRADFRFSETDEAAFLSDGVPLIPMSSLSPEAVAFERLCYDDDWIKPEIDWPSWLEGEEADGLLGDPTSIADASVEQIEHILTALVRSARFNDGALKAAYSHGILTAVVERCGVLAATTR